MKLAGEVDDVIQGLRVRLHDGDPPHARVALSPAGLAISTADPNRLCRWAALLIDAADQLDLAHRGWAEPETTEQASLFEAAT